jgi:hypothetical protein
MAYRQSQAGEPVMPVYLCAHRVSHGGQNSDVRANDLAFSLHCNLMSTLMLVQMLMYDGGGQRVTAVCWAASSGDYIMARTDSLECSHSLIMCHVVL